MTDVPDEVRALAADRQDRRNARDFAAADALRDRIRDLGFNVIDGAEGPTFEPVEPEPETRLRPHDVASLLELVLPPNGLAAVVRGNIVHVTTKADALGPPVARLYPITHLTWRLTDFIAPSLDLHPSGWTGSEEEAEVVREDGLDAEGIAALVREQVTADWSQEGWGITANARFLVVRAPRSVHVQVAAALARIEAFR